MNTRITRRIRRLAATGAAVAALAAAGVATAGAASATDKNGVVETGELGLYYYQNYSGPVFDLYYADSNFAGDVFPGTSIGANDNTESDWNRDTYTWYVYTGAGATGSGGYISPGAYGNLTATFSNQISSAYWYVP